MQDMEDQTLSAMEAIIHRWEKELDCFWPEWKPNRVMKVVSTITNVLAKAKENRKTIAKRIDTSNIPWLIVQFVLFGGWYSCQEPQSAVYMLLTIMKVFYASGVSAQTVSFMIDMMNLDEIVQRLKNGEFEQSTEDCVGDDKKWVNQTFIAKVNIQNIEALLTKIQELRMRCDVNVKSE